MCRKFKLFKNFMFFPSMQKIFAIPFLGSHSCTLKWKFGAKFFQTRYLGHDKCKVFLVNVVCNSAWKISKIRANSLAKLLYISHAVSIFTEQKLKFGLDFGQLALLKKKLGSIMSNFWEPFSSRFHGQKIILASTLECSPYINGPSKLHA